MNNQQAYQTIKSIKDGLEVPLPTMCMAKGYLEDRKAKHLEKKDKEMAEEMNKIIVWLNQKIKIKKQK